MLDKWTNDHPGSETKILMTDQPNTMRLSESNDGRLGAHMPFNFQLIYVPKDASPPHSDTWLGNMPQGHTDKWAVSKRVNFSCWRSLRLARAFSIFEITQMTRQRWHRTLDKSEGLDPTTDRPTDRTNGKLKDETSCCVLKDFSQNILDEFFFISFLCVCVFFRCGQIGSHNHSRVATRMGTHLAPIMPTINQMRPGSSYNFSVSIPIDSLCFSPAAHLSLSLHLHTS